MKKLYGSTNWRRVLALVLVFAMMFSAMGTSGYSVFADDPDESGEVVYAVEPEAVDQEVSEDIQGPSPGEEGEALEEAAEPVEEAEEAEEAAEVEEAAEPAEEAEEAEEAAEDEEAAEPAEEAEEAEEAAEVEEAAEPAEEIEEAEEAVEDEEAAEPAEEAEEVEEEEEAAEVEEAAEPTEEAEEVTLIEEASQVILKDDGSEAEAVEEPVIPEGPASFPAAKFGATTVKVTAEPYTFPEGTTVEIKEVTLGRTQMAAVSNAVDEEIVSFKAYDITFYDADGDEIQPAKPVKVNIDSSRMGDFENLQVVHIEDNNKEATVIDSVDETRNGLKFDAEHFSVYVVVETVVPRLMITFMNVGGTGEPIATMFVKKADTAAEVKQIIYDPGAGDIPKGQVFKGWTTDYEFNAKSDLLTIEEVRAAAMAEAAELETDGYVIYYAAVFKQFTVTYVDSKNITVGTEVVEIPVYETEADYFINMDYTTDDSHNLEGWIVADGGDNISGYPENATEDVIGDDDEAQTVLYYPIGTKISISGDVRFSVNAPEGHWLVFEENGKGATYCAPSFVRSGKVTALPRPEDDMLRNGYTFGGWYDTKAHADAHGADPNVTDGKFEFGSTIDKTTTIYASWIPIKTAGYTVIFWTQNVSRTGYDVKQSVFVDGGTVGQTITYTPVDNGDEDYVTFNEKDYHYPGFCLKAADANQQVAITPEGDAVLNLHFDRIEYNLKFYLYRQNNAGYSYATYSNEGRNVWGIAEWATVNANNLPSTSYGEILHKDNIDNYTGYYFVLTAYYGEDIHTRWPSYDQITGPTVNNTERAPVSFVMMNGTKLKGNGINDNGYGDGRDTVKGLISVMNEDILGATNDADGNYLIVRFNTFNSWTYNIYYEAPNGQAPNGETTKELNGKVYYKADEIAARSTNTDPAQQNAPEYQGYEVVKDGNRAYYLLNSTCNLDYYYDRQEYHITYFDGIYVDGDDNVLHSHPDKQLGVSEDVGFGLEIPEKDKDFRPEKANEDGYVFEGWYADEACASPYTFGTMALDGIKVYAKWRLIQYRVFLHPNAGTDSTLSWGSENQAMNFRVSFGGKISVPTGYRNGYEFFGWYTDEKLSKPYTSNTVLNESTVSAAYDKTEKTDDMDKWGNIKADSPTPEGVEGVGYNSDSYKYNKETKEFEKTNRFWITRKLDLYAKWSAITVGADGIGVIYDDAEGSNAPSDTALYKDNTFVSAGAAATAPSGKVFDHWVLQTWNGEAYEDTETEVLAGETFTILKSDAKIVDAETGVLVDPAAVVKEGKYIYTVQLKAVYKDIEEETPTHINWYSNFGSENNGKGALYQEDTDLKINEAILIYGFENETESWKIPTRAGYKFLGWTKTKGGKTPDFLTWTEEEEGGLYVATVDEEEIVAFMVAADEKQPYEDLYAVWEPLEVTYTVEFYYQSEDDLTYVKDEELTDIREAKSGSKVSVTDEDKLQTRDDEYKLVEDSPSVLSAEVAGDGSTVLKLYFTLKGMHLKIEKEVTEPPKNGETYALGETIFYKVTVTNDGELTVNKFLVVDEMTGDEWEVESLDPGKSVSFDAEYVVTEDDILNGEIVNVATVMPQTPVDPPADPDTPETPEIPLTPHDPVVVTPDPVNPHVTISKETASKPANGEKYAIGEEVTYEITVLNDGNVTITDIVVTDELTGDEWTIDTLAPNEEETFETKSYKVTIQDAIKTKVYNEATGTGKGPEETPAKVDPGVKEVDVIPVGATITVAFYTNYPAAAELKDVYTKPETVKVPYNVPGFIDVFRADMIPEGYETDGWEVHRPVKAAADGADTANSSSSMASASSSSEATFSAVEPEADLIFYAQWKALPDDEPEPEPGPTPPGPNPPEPTPPGPNPPKPTPDKPEPVPSQPEPPIEEPEDEIIEDEPPLADYEEEPDDEIDEEPTPFSPYTGDDRHTAAWGFVSLLSLAGIVVVARKRREEE